MLGVSPSASDDEIKKAYRDLTRKYHPDANVDNPLADLAEEKFKEVQEAYDMIMKERASGIPADTPMAEEVIFLWRQLFLRVWEHWRWLRQLSERTAGSETAGRC